ncbi:SRPBCC family protein [Actinoplanes sp. NPDC048988]|uniref:SRPBCC family protein n=1 Tax=Actinoplanes sp. NPDC048988 TaxID=3363901 RepID=UPI00370FD042
MKITNEFTVHTPIDRAWRVLTDLEGIAGCMPGAQLTGVEGDVYQGKVKVKVGPVVSEFAGTARFTEKDESAYRAVIDAKGRDARSAGNAAALVTAVLSPSGDDSTLVSVDTDLKISGKLAQFGSGMIKEVSSKLLTQFVANLEAKLATDATTPTAGPASSAPPASAPPASAPPAPEAADSSAEAADHTAATTASAAAVETAAETSISPAAVELAASPAGHALNGRAPTSAAAAVATPAAIDAAAVATPAAIDAAATAETEPLDLLDLAGGSLYKRLIPVAVGVVVVGAVIVWAVGRR